VTDWSNPDLAALRSHMSKTLTERDKTAGASAGGQRLSDFVGSQRVHVEEVDASHFDRAVQHWASDKPK